MNTARDWTKVKLNPFQPILTEELLEALPEPYATDGNAEAKALVHFFGGPYDFYAKEFDPRTGEFFGLVHLHEWELGYVSADDLIGIRIPPLGTHLERDEHWTPKTISEIRKGKP